jgi:hypothetical protein
VINPSQRPLPDSTQHSQQKNIHPPPRGIRTHNLSRRAAEDLRLRPRGHWDRHILSIVQFNLGLPWSLNAVPCVRGLIAYLSTQFNPRSVHVGFVVDKVARGQVFLLVSFHQCYILTYITRRRDARSRGSLKSAVALIGEHCIEKYLHLVFKGLNTHRHSIFDST